MRKLLVPLIGSNGICNVALLLDIPLDDVAGGINGVPTVVMLAVAQETFATIKKITEKTDDDWTNEMSFDFLK